MRVSDPKNLSFAHNEYAVFVLMSSTNPIEIVIIPIILIFDRYIIIM